MKMCIWKFELGDQLPGTFEIKMPHKPRPVAAGMLNGKLCIWAEVDPGAVQVTEYIVVLPTGETEIKPLPNGEHQNLVHIDTVQQRPLDGFGIVGGVGALMWHVYHAQWRTNGMD